MPGNVEIALAAMDGFNRRDYEAGLGLFDPDVEWTVGSELSPDSGTYRGREGIREFWNLWHETFEQFEIVTDQCEEAPGGHVVTMVRTHGWGTGSGIEVLSPPFCQIFRIRDGLITHVWLYGRRETALQAAGIEDPA